MIVDSVDISNISDEESEEKGYKIIQRTPHHTLACNRISGLVNVMFEHYIVHPDYHSVHRSGGATAIMLLSHLHFQYQFGYDWIQQQLLDLLRFVSFSLAILYRRFQVNRDPDYTFNNPMCIHWSLLAPILGNKQKNHGLIKAEKKRGLLDFLVSVIASLTTILEGNKGNLHHEFGEKAMDVEVTSDRANELILSIFKNTEWLYYVVSYILREKEESDHNEVKLTKMVLHLIQVGV